MGPWKERLDNSRYNEYYAADETSQSGEEWTTVSRLSGRSRFPGLAARDRHAVPRADRVLKTEDLSATQYNVLRILRGAPEGLPCGEIANRMITRDPDVTRLLDRLEKRGLISRCRETKDRRTVMARITPDGLKLWPGWTNQCRTAIADNWATWAASGCGP